MARFDCRCLGTTIVQMDSTVLQFVVESPDFADRSAPQHWTAEALAVPEVTEQTVVEMMVALVVLLVELD